MLIIIIAATFYALSRFADLWTSRRGLYYGTSESNKLFRNKDGEINTLVYVLVSVAIGMGIAVATFFVPYLWTMYLPFTLGSFVVAWTNYNQQQKNRLEQIAFLQNIHVQMMAGATETDVIPMFAGMLTSEGNGQIWFPLFAWIKVPGRLGDDSVSVLIQAIIDVAKQTAEKWFPE